MASEMSLRVKGHLEAPAINPKPLPSLVVCPSTLVPHWEYEILKFVPEDSLLPVQYAGTPKERAAMRKKLAKLWGPEIQKEIEESGEGNKEGSGKAGNGEESLRKSPNVLVASYEALKADSDWLCSLNWHFCILDEGHVIKSGKTAVATAVKKIKAEHRLLLSGTPLQVGFSSGSSVFHTLKIWSFNL